MKEICGRWRRNVTSRSPFGVTSSRLRYQDLRGLTRSFSADLPAIRSQVHLTSAGVNGLPSCHLTPGRNLKVSSLPSSLHDQLEARSGTIESRLFCGRCWSNMTKLLNTPIIGPRATIVDSSWSDTLARLVPSGILRTPPGFCARAAACIDRPASAPHASAMLRSLAFICLHPLRRVGSPAPCRGLIFDARGLLVEPDVLHSVAVVDAVDHRHEPLDIGLRTGAAARIEDDRPRAVLGQLSFASPAGEEMVQIGWLSRAVQRTLPLSYLDQPRQDGGIQGA